MNENENEKRKMTSPLPMSLYDPMCSYCHKEVKNPLLFFLGNDLHWACSERCKKGLSNKEKIIDNPKILLNELIGMYVEISEDLVELSNRPLLKRIFKIK